MKLIEKIKKWLSNKDGQSDELRETEQTQQVNVQTIETQITVSDSKVEGVIEDVYGPPSIDRIEVNQRYEYVYGPPSWYERK